MLTSFDLYQNGTPLSKNIDIGMLRWRIEQVGRVTTRRSPLSPDSDTPGWSVEVEEVVKPMVR
jgi:hypothetical protein